MSIRFSPPSHISEGTQQLGGVSVQLLCRMSRSNGERTVSDARDGRDQTL